MNTPTTTVATPTTATTPLSTNTTVAPTINVPTVTSSTTTNPTLTSTVETNLPTETVPQQDTESPSLNSQITNAIPTTESTTQNQNPIIEEPADSQHATKKQKTEQKSETILTLETTPSTDPVEISEEAPRVDSDSLDTMETGIGIFLN